MLELIRLGDRGIMTRKNVKRKYAFQTPISPKQLLSFHLLFSPRLCGQFKFWYCFPLLSCYNLYCFIAKDDKGYLRNVRVPATQINDVVGKRHRVCTYTTPCPSNEIKTRSGLTLGRFIMQKLSTGIAPDYRYFALDIAAQTGPLSTHHYGGAKRK